MTRSQWALVVIVLVLIGGMIAVYRAMGEAQERPAVQRITTVEVLADHAAVLRAWREAHAGAWPEDLPTLRGFSKELGEDRRLFFTSNHVPRTDIFYQYRRPQGDDPAQAVMAAPTPNRAVAVGEEYGAKGEVATQPLPPVYYVLTADLEVEARDRPAPWVVAGEED